MRYSIGMQRTPVETLGQADVEAARELVATRGLAEAARLLGLSTWTVLKTLAPVPVHRMTANMVRAGLSRISANRI